MKPYIVTPHLNRLIQMKGHYLCFQLEFTKITPNYHQLLPVIQRYDSKNLQQIIYLCINKFPRIFSQ